MACRLGAPRERGDHRQGWRESYLEAKNQEILKVFVDEARTPTERFWELGTMRGCGPGCSMLSGGANGP